MWLCLVQLLRSHRWSSCCGSCRLECRCSSGGSCQQNLCLVRFEAGTVVYGFVCLLVDLHVCRVACVVLDVWFMTGMSNGWQHGGCGAVDFACCRHTFDGVQLRLLLFWAPHNVVWHGGQRLLVMHSVREAEQQQHPRQRPSCTSPPWAFLPPPLGAVGRTGFWMVATNHT